MNERDKQTLAEIECIRAANNSLWMKIVEIALEHAPEDTKRVLGRIKMNDRDVTDRLGDLAQ